MHRWLSCSGTVYFGTTTSQVMEMNVMKIGGMLLGQLYTVLTESYILPRVRNGVRMQGLRLMQGVPDCQA